MSIKITKRQEIVDDVAGETTYLLQKITNNNSIKYIDIFSQSELNELYELLAQHVKV